MLVFTYCGKEGHVDPYYTPGKGYSYLLWFDGAERLVYDMDAVMHTPIFGGQALADIADSITDIDWY